LSAFDVLNELSCESANGKCSRRIESVRGMESVPTNSVKGLKLLRVFTVREFRVVRRELTPSIFFLVVFTRAAIEPAYFSFFFSDDFEQCRIVVLCDCLAARKRPDVKTEK